MSKSEFTFSQGVKLLHKPVIDGNAAWTFNDRPTKTLPKAKAAEKNFKDFLESEKPQQGEELLKKWKDSGFSREQLEELKLSFHLWNKNRLKAAHSAGGKKRAEGRKKPLDSIFAAQNGQQQTYPG